ncbi:serine/threonine protein kinase, AGC [Paramarasmius palmivorus]|uniref:Serine/threonine protein kinase, AGC n=1 Tax=Paramarasmius palmivorus TaxID=297713 RepID=A0AAW0CR17_9AGAR
MENGDIISFIRRNPDHDRLRSISEISAGLEYLHSLNIVHGDIKGVNILVDDKSQCRLADFGLAAATGESHNTTSSGGLRGTIRWLAPEVFANTPTKDKRPRDIYAYACTIYEIMALRPPFYDLVEPAVLLQVVVLKKRPERPIDAWCPDNIWDLVERCWAEETEQRLQAEHVHAYLEKLLKLREMGNVGASELLFEDFSHNEEGSDPKHETARPSRKPRPLPPIPHAKPGPGQATFKREVPPLDTSRHHEAELSDKQASSEAVAMQWVRGELIGKSTYSRTYLALRVDGSMMAATQVEVTEKEDHRQQLVVDALWNQVNLMKGFDHPNVLGYLGFEKTYDTLTLQCLSVDKTSNRFKEYLPMTIGGTVRKHGKLSDGNVKHFTSQIASGLEYLHSKGILHRDLKGDNIFINYEGTCKISDFSISKRVSNTLDIDADVNTAMQGTIFWMAPEVVNSGSQSYDYKADIWSLGCVVLEMASGARPWAGHEVMAVLMKLYQDKDPSPMPEDVELPNLAYDFIGQCLTR